MATASVCVTFDFDAVSIWLHTFDSQHQASRHSRGVFGAEVAAPRILDLLDRTGVDTSWFVPGHTIESFPKVCAEIWERGHDIQHHGWSHTDPVKYETRADEEADLKRGMDTIEDLTGRAPVGYRSPAGEFSEHTVDLLSELGFAYDSSMLDHDFELYRLRADWSAPLDEPYDPGEETNLIEVPRSWQRNDFTALTYIPYPQLWGYADEDSIFGKWRDQFDWMYDNIDGGTYVLVLHPQCIGQAHRLTRLEALIDYMDRKPDVAFRTVTDVVEEYREA